MIKREIFGLLLFVAALGVLAALTGCGGGTSPLLVKQAVPVECKVQKPDRPAMPTDALQPGASLDRITAAALAEIDLRESYEIKLVAALDVCLAPVGPLEGGRRGA